MSKKPTIDHASRLEWTHFGQCRYRIYKKKKCKGTPGYSGGCQGTYTDDYGSYQSCPECHGSGSIRYPVWIRVPEFDAPKPSKNWVPDWVEE